LYAQEDEGTALTTKLLKKFINFKPSSCTTILPDPIQQQATE
jgi:hypothetical protein